VLPQALVVDRRMALRHKYPADEMLTSTFTLRSLEVRREDGANFKYDPTKVQAQILRFSEKAGRVGLAVCRQLGSSTLA
jgi:hypothetical protein